MQRSLTFVRSHAAPSLAGALLLLLALWYERQGWRAPAIAFAVAGALALAFRVVCRVDARRGHARVCWTELGVPVLGFRRVPLESLRAVEVELSYLSDRDGEPRKWWRVRVRGERVLTLHASGNLLAARRFGKRVARALRLPLQDRSTGRFLERQPNELEMNLGERLRRRGHAPDFAAVPAGSRLRFRDGTEKQIELPPSIRTWTMLALALLAFVGAPAAIAVWLWQEPLGNAQVGAAFLAIFASLGGWRTMAARRPALLVVGPDAVELRSFRSRRRIALHDLDEIVHCRWDLHLLSDEVHVILPYNFQDASEARFVTGVIEHAAYHHASARPGL